uniref:Uncharacterized protein n=1 Tax=Tanacetum cinerariifolium TaxID=118510 RepID=A0A6L2MA56_TANCI|nr:hypothetical protein [Tanacetum cinerariifolium]
MRGSDSEAFEAASHSPEYDPPADDDLEPADAEALSAHVSPVPLSLDYSADSELIEHDPQEANLEDDHEEYPSEEEEEELPALAASTQAIPDPTSPSEEIETFEEDEETNERVTDLDTRYRKDSHEMLRVNAVRLRVNAVWGGVNAVWVGVNAVCVGDNVAKPNKP